ncbi:MAG TPA: nodulation protein NfeD [Dehalococcoidia bacterium]|nr:nodulation protein NfeD [Dehalococcoidia bacterium]
MFKTILRIIYISFFISSIFCFVSATAAEAASPAVDVINVEGNIVPVVAGYIDRAITDAEKRGSAACIIQLNTPGGLLDSTEKIVGRIMNARIPVIVYVAPHGAWAASAGTFITVSAHIAVMSPGSTIGAAHPVSVGEEVGEDMVKKATEYSAAWIRSIAETRGKNAEEMDLAVRESKSFTAEQALQSNLIDFIAEDIDDLLAQIDGKEVTLAENTIVVLNTLNVSVFRVEMTPVEDFVKTISNPNIAYILLSLATIGLFVEITNPGLIFPGVAGGICLIISLYALGSLNAYWAGLLFIFLAFGMFIAEIFTSTFGILTGGGIISLVAGSLLLFINNPPSLQINPAVIIIVVILIAAFFVFVIGMIVRGQKRKVETGEEGLLGKVATVKTRLSPKGMVLVEGELWNAALEEGVAEEGDEVTVIKVEGLKLIVTKK